MRLITPTLALAVLFSASAMRSQQAPPAPEAGDLIHLNVVVTPGNNGTPIPDLPQGNFTILDNGAAQPIVSYRALKGQSDPVKVLIVIDAVNVDYTRLAYERQQIDRFLRANEGRLAQPTGLAIVTDTTTEAQAGYTTDGNALSQLLAKQVLGLRDLRRSAGFYGAEERLDLSLKAMDQFVTRNASEPGRKFLLWVTPGWPLISGPAVQLSGKDQDHLFREIVGFSDALRRAGTTVYAVDPLGAGEGPGRTFYYEQFTKGVKKPSQTEPGDLGVQVFATQTGGLFLSGNNDISALLQKCYADATARYEIVYQAPPAENPNEYHRIEVRMAEPREVARTLQGYYAQPSASR